MPLLPALSPTSIVIGLSVALTLLVTVSAVLVLLLHHQNNREERLRQKLFSRWRPLVFVYLDGGPLDPELRQAARREPRWLLELAVHLATLLRGSTFERLRELLAETGLTDWLVKGLHSRRETRITAAARALAVFRVPEAKPRLLRLLDSYSPAVVFAAALALARIAERDDLPRLLDTMAEFSSTHQDLVVVVLLGYAEEHPTEFVDYLRAYETEDQDLKVLLLEVLGRLRIREAGDLLRAEAESPSSPEAELKALRALGELQFQAAADVVHRALSSERWETRAVAAWSAGRLKDPENLQRLTELLADEAWAVRLNAANALSSMDEAGRQSLQAVAENPGDRFAGDMAQHALDRSEKAVPIL